MSGDGTQDKEVYKQGDLLEKRRISDGIRNWYREGELVANSVGNLLENPTVTFKNSNKDENQELRIAFVSDKSLENHIRQNVENNQELFIDLENIITDENFNLIGRFSSDQTYEFSIKEKDSNGRIKDPNHEQLRINNNGEISYKYGGSRDTQYFEITITDSSGETWSNDFIINLTDKYQYNEVYANKTGGDSIYWNDEDKTPILIKKDDNSINLGVIDNDKWTPRGSYPKLGEDIPFIISKDIRASRDNTLDPNKKINNEKFDKKFHIYTAGAGPDKNYTLGERFIFKETINDNGFLELFKKNNSPWDFNSDFDFTKTYRAYNDNELNLFEFWTYDEHNYRYDLERSKYSWSIIGGRDKHKFSIDNNCRLRINKTHVENLAGTINNVIISATHSSGEKWERDLDIVFQEDSNEWFIYSEPRVNSPYITTIYSGIEEGDTISVQINDEVINNGDFDGINEETITYQWLYDDFSPIEGETNKSYKIGNLVKDGNKKSNLYVEVHYEDKEGFSNQRLLGIDLTKNNKAGIISNDSLVTIKKRSDNNSIDFEFVSGAIINDPEGNINFDSKRESLSSYHKYRWLRDGELISITGEPKFTIDSNNYGKWELEIGYTDKEGYRQISSPYNISEISSSKTNIPSDIKFNLSYDDKILTEESNIKVEFDISQLNPYLDDIQRHDIKYRFGRKKKGTDAYYGGHEGSLIGDHDGKYYDDYSFNNYPGWIQIEKEHIFRLDKEGYSPAENYSLPAYGHVHRFQYKKDSQRSSYNRPSIRHYDDNELFTDYFLELSFNDKQGNNHIIKTDSLFNLSSSDNYGRDYITNGNFVEDLHLKKIGNKYRLNIGDIVNDSDGLSLIRGENWSLQSSSSNSAVHVKYAKELWGVDDFSKINYRWYKDDVIVDEGYTSYLDIEENEIKGFWKVEADYIDDQLLKNTINSSLDIRKFNNNPIEEKVKIVPINNPNENKYLKASFDFDHADGVVKDSVYYQWYLNENLVSTTFNNTYIPSSSGVYSVHLNFLDCLGFEEKSVSDSVNFSLSNNDYGEANTIFNSYNEKNNIIIPGHYQYAPLVTEDDDGISNLLVISSGTSPYYLHDPLGPNIELKFSSGENLTDALSPEWNGLYAIKNDSEYNILLEGNGNYLNQFKVIKANANGEVVDFVNEPWLTSKQLKSNYRFIYDNKPNYQWYRLKDGGRIEDRFADDNKILLEGTRETSFYVEFTGESDPNEFIWSYRSRSNRNGLFYDINYKDLKGYEQNITHEVNSNLSIPKDPITGRTVLTNNGQLQASILDKNLGILKEGDPIKFYVDQDDPDDGIKQIKEIKLTKDDKLVYKAVSDTHNNINTYIPGHGDVVFDNSTNFICEYYKSYQDIPWLLRDTSTGYTNRILEELNPLEYIIPSDGVGKYKFEISYIDSEGHDENFISNEINIYSADNGKSEIINNKLTHLYEGQTFSLNNSIPISTDSSRIEFITDFSDSDGIKKVIPKKLIINDKNVELISQNNEFNSTLSNSVTNDGSGEISITAFDRDENNISFKFNKAWNDPDGVDIYPLVLFNIKTHQVLTLDDIEKGDTGWTLLDPDQNPNYEHPAFSKNNLVVQSNDLAVSEHFWSSWIISDPTSSLVEFNNWVYPSERNGFGEFYTNDISYTNVKNYKWYKNDEPIIDSNSSSYTFNTNELSFGDKISLGLEYVDSKNNTNTSISEPFIYKESTVKETEFSIIGKPEVGKTLSINSISDVHDEDIEILKTVWYVDTNPNLNNGWKVVGEGSTYLIKEGYDGRQIKAGIHYTNSDGFTGIKNTGQVYVDVAGSSEGLLISEYEISGKSNVVSNFLYELRNVGFSASKDRFQGFPAGWWESMSGARAENITLKPNYSSWNMRKHTEDFDINDVMSNIPQTTNWLEAKWDLSAYANPSGGSYYKAKLSSPIDIDIVLKDNPTIEQLAVINTINGDGIITLNDPNISFEGDDFILSRALSGKFSSPYNGDIKYNLTRNIDLNDLTTGKITRASIQNPSNPSQPELIVSERIDYQKSIDIQPYVDKFGYGSYQIEYEVEDLEGNKTQLISDKRYVNRKNNIGKFIREFDNEGTSLNNFYSEGDSLKPYKIYDKNAFSETQNVNYSLFRQSSGKQEHLGDAEDYTFPQNSTGWFWYKAEYQDEEGFNESIISEPFFVAQTNGGPGKISLNAFNRDDNNISFKFNNLSNDPDGNLKSIEKYLWLRNGRPIRDSNSSSYTFKTNELSYDDKISLNIEYIDSQNYHNTSISEAYAYKELPFSVEGAATVGQTLRITETSADPDETVNLSYNWQTSTDGNNWSVVGTNSTYTVAATEEGKSIKAVVSYTDQQGFSEDVNTTTNNIPYVDDGVASFSISGTAEVGQILSITEDIADADGTGSLSHSWQTSSDGNNWSVVGTNSTYTVAATEERKSIKAVLSYTDQQGFDETVTTNKKDIPIFNNGDATFSIDGTANVGETLEVSQGKVDPDGNGTLSYSWQTSNDGNTWSVVGTSSTYTVAATEEGKSIKAVLSYTDQQGFDETVTTPKSDIPYVDHGDASFSINGTAKVGQTLGIKSETADPDGNGTLSYSWQTSTDDSTWSVVGTNSTYTVAGSEEGKSIKAFVSYTDQQGFAEEIVTTATGKVPYADHGDASFSINGTAKVGATLEVSQGKVDPDGNGTLSYSWQTSSDSNTWSVVGTSSTYTVAATEEGKSIKAVLSYTDQQGFDEVVTTPTSYISYVDHGDTSFSINGTAKVGQTLGIKTETADPDGNGTLSYSWQTSTDDSTWSVVGTSSTYTVAATEEGKSIKAVLSYTDQKGFDEVVTATNKSIPYVDDGVAFFSISGTAEVGQILSISEDTADADGTGTLSYSWQTSSYGNNWSVVGTDSTYTVAGTEEGKSIKAVLSYTDQQGFDETVTTPKSDIPYVDHGDASFSINGTANVGETLEVSQGKVDPDGNGTLSYSWQTSNDGNTWSVVGTSSTYTVAATEEGKSIKAVLSYTDQKGFDEVVTATNKSIPYVDDGVASFSISGTAEVGQILSISEDTADADGTGTLSYSWQISNDSNTWSEVGTTSTYTVAATEEGKSIKAVLSYTDQQGFDEVVTTNKKDIPIFNNGDATFSIDGIAKMGETLGVKQDRADPDGTGTLIYQWQSSSDRSSWSNVSTNSSYLLKYSDSNQYVRSIISYTDNDGFNESITTNSIRVEKHYIHSSIDQLQNQLANLTYYSNFNIPGYSEEFGTANSDSLYGSGNEIVWGLGGDDTLQKIQWTAGKNDNNFLFGGSGNDTYRIKQGDTTYIYEAPNHGYDKLYLESDFTNGYAIKIDNRHLIAYDNVNDLENLTAIVVLDAENGEEVNFAGTAYSTNDFLNLLPSFPGYLGNFSWEESSSILAGAFSESAGVSLTDEEIEGIRIELENTKNLIERIKTSVINIERSQETQVNNINSQIEDLLSQATTLDYLIASSPVNTDGNIDLLKDSNELAYARDADGNISQIQWNGNHVGNNTWSGWSFKAAETINGTNTIVIQKDDTKAIEVWTTDDTNTWSANAYNTYQDNSASFFATETSFSQDFNADGNIGRPPVSYTNISTDGSIDLIKDASDMVYARDADGNISQIQWNGNHVGNNTWNGWSFKAAETINGTNTIVIQKDDTKAIEVWTTDNTNTWSANAYNSYQDNSASFFSTETSFSQDFNADGNIGRPPVSYTNINTDGSIDLIKDASDMVYARDADGNISEIKWNGNHVGNNTWSGWSFKAAETINGTNTIVIQKDDTKAIEVWTTDNTNTWSANAYNSYQDNSASFFSTETSFSQDFNADGNIGRPPVSYTNINTDGSIDLIKDASDMVYARDADGNISEIQWKGNHVGNNTWSGWSFKAAETINGTNTIVIQKDDTKAIEVWTTDNTNTWSANAYNSYQNNSASFFSTETSFSQDFNADGNIGRPPVSYTNISTDGSIDLIKDASDMVYARDADGNISQIQWNGNHVGNNTWNGWSFKAAETINGTNTIVIQKDDTKAIEVWTTDNTNTWSANAYNSYQDNSASFFSTETSFSQDFNADGNIGRPPVSYTNINTDGSIDLIKDASDMVYARDADGNISQIQWNGNHVGNNTWSGWSFKAAETINGTNTIVIQKDDTKAIEVWTTDNTNTWSANAYNSYQDNSASFFSTETSFSQDFNADGNIGRPPVSYTNINTDGSIDLIKDASDMVYARDADGNISQIQWNGNHVGNNTWNGWSFKAAETINGTNTIVIQEDSTKAIEVWTTDNTNTWSANAYNSYQDNSASFFSTETSFSQDFNADGNIGRPPVSYTNINTDGSIDLIKDASDMVYARDADGNISQIKWNGNHVGNNTWNGWSFKAAETINGTNTIVIQKDDTKAIEVWTTDNTNTWSANAYNTYQDNSASFFSTETSFSQDFNADGNIGRPPVSYTNISTDGSIDLIKDASDMVYARDADGNISQIKWNGNHVGNNSWSGWSFKVAETINGINQVVIDHDANNVIQVLIANGNSWDMTDYKEYAYDSSDFYSIETRFQQDFDGNSYIGNPFTATTMKASVLNTLDSSSSDPFDASSIVTITGTLEEIKTAYSSNGITGLGNETIILSDAINGVSQNDITSIGNLTTGDRYILYPEDQQLIGGAGVDSLIGGIPNEILFGLAGDDTLTGDAGNDQLIGGLGNDTLKGGSGNDTLIGGLGDDILHGNSGLDIFQIVGAGKDTIKDFTKGEDKIDISSLETYTLGSQGNNAVLYQNDNIITIVENLADNLTPSDTKDYLI
ncbi:hypothetical protein [Prochlorococcus marinus]|uniref:hypothetical protein n=1 Tax=Prochlorococcus marinus TaxID=1219 RepID=UPI0022B47FBA|nr:hypothetical protein [Prochlorococcus marinus]